MSTIKERLRKQRKHLFPDIPRTKKDIQDFAQKMWDYILKNDECHSIDDFIVHAQISHAELRQLCEESELFAKTYSLVKSCISSRIQKGWQKGKLDRVYAMKFIELYNEEYRNMQLERVALRSAVEERTRNSVDIVEVEKFVPVSQDEYDRIKDEASA